MTRKTYFILFIAFYFSMIVAMLLPLEFMRSVAPPANKIVSGPLYGGALVIGPPLLMMVVYLIGPLRRVLPAVRAANYSQEAVNAALRQLTFKLDILSVAPALCLSIMYIYGLSAYWYATPEGIFEQKNIFMRPDHYRWGDISQLHLSCYQAKGGPNVGFILTFKDGSKLDIAHTQQQAFIENFWTLTQLTATATLISDVRDPSVCPRPVSLFLSHRS